MRSLITLIDEAAELCGGYAALARRIGVKPQHINAWKHGDRPMTPETVAELCDLLQLDGEEARRLAVLAVVENPKNREKAPLLRRAFFVCWALGAALMLLFADETHESQTEARAWHAIDRSKIDAALKALMARLYHRLTAIIGTRARTPRPTGIAAAG